MSKMETVNEFSKERVRKIIDMSKMRLDFDQRLTEVAERHGLIRSKYSGFQRGVNRVAREQGFSFQMLDGDGEWYQITTLPCQVGLDNYMKKAVTQINTYEIQG